MSDTTQHWLRSPEGVHAVVVGDAERDRWRNRAWVDAEEPIAGDQRVQIWHPAGPAGGEASFAAFTDTWQVLGWMLGPPPGGVHPAVAAAASAGYAERTVDDLRNELTARDLPTSGRKPELIERLTAADTAPTDTETAAGGTPEGSDD